MGGGEGGGGLLRRIQVGGDARAVGRGIQVRQIPRRQRRRRRAAGRPGPRAGGAAQALGVCSSSASKAAAGSVKGMAPHQAASAYCRHAPCPPCRHGHGHAGHSHAGHGHAGHSHAPASFGRAFAIGMALNAALVALQAGAGAWAHSTALLADAVHNLGDVMGLGFAWLAASLGGRRPDRAAAPMAGAAAASSPPWPTPACCWSAPAPSWWRRCSASCIPPPSRAAW